MKKYIASIGAIATTVAPIIMVVSCTKKPVQTQEKLDTAVANKAIAKINKATLEGSVDLEKLASASKDSITRDIILGLDPIKDLTDAQRELISVVNTPDNSTGKLTSTISVQGGKNNAVVINGFKTQANLDAIAANTAIAKINETMLKSKVDLNKLASASKNSITRDIILGLDPFKDLTDAQKALISVVNTPDNSTGKLTSTISVQGGKNNAVVINGFKTQANLDVIAANTAIAKINETMLKSKVDLNKLASASKDSITRDIILGLDPIKDLTDAQKALISVANTPDDSTGKLTSTISVQGGNNNAVVINGFKTQANLDAIAANEAIAKINETMLKSKVDLNKLASASKDSITRDIILGLDPIKDLTDAQKALISVANTPDDSTGKLTSTISVQGGNNNEVVISGFKTQADLDVIAANTAIAKINETMLKSKVDLNKLASASKDSITRDIILGLDPIKDLTDAQKALISVANTPDDSTGKLTSTISVQGGNNNEVVISGFKTQADLDVIAANEAIAKINETMLKSKVDLNKLASASKDSITRDIILGLDPIKDLTDAQKALISVANTPDDSTGKLTSTISVQGGNNNEVVISGFKTQADLDVIAANTAIAKINETMLKSKVDLNKLASASKNSITRDIILGLDPIKDLTDAQKALISVINTPNNSTRTLTSTISVTGGKNNAVVINGFKTQADLDAIAANTAIAKINETMLKSKVDLNKLASASKNSITRDIILGLDPIKDLTDAQKALISVANTPDDSTGKLTSTISVQGGNNNEVVISGFKTQADLDVIAANTAIAKINETMLKSKVDLNKLASASKNSITRDIILGLDPIKDLTDAQKGLISVINTPNNSTRTLTSTISVTGGNNNEVVISGFKTQADLDVIAANTAIAKINETMLKSKVDLNKLASASKNSITRDIILGLDPIKDLTDAQKALISVINTPNNSTRTLTSTISVTGGKNNAVVINGFKTQADLDAIAANTAIAKINEGMLKTKVDLNKLASASKDSITRDIILGLDPIKDLTDAQKAFISVATAYDIEGTLKITITVAGGKNNAVVINGFKTQADLDAIAANEAIAKINEGMLKTKVDLNKLASASKDSITANTIKNLTVIQDLSLSAAQLKLITVENVANDNAKTLTISINVNGKTAKTITIDGFKTQAYLDIIHTFNNNQLLKAFFNPELFRAKRKLLGVSDFNLLPLKTKINLFSTAFSAVLDTKLSGAQRNLITNIKWNNTNGKATLSFYIDGILKEVKYK